MSPPGGEKRRKDRLSQVELLRVGAKSSRKKVTETGSQEDPPKAEKRRPEKRRNLARSQRRKDYHFLDELNG